MIDTDSKWTFTPHVEGQKVRASLTSEFFSDDTLKEAEPLVRESIQNSLDAVSDGQTLKLRIYASLDKGRRHPDEVEPWVRGLEPHLDKIRGSRQALKLPRIDREDCPFMVIEDFGTLGLSGDPNMWNAPPEGERNNFFHFFRAEGLSDKSAGERGSWGVGKVVFASASEVRGFFGYTIRQEDGRHLLMGQLALPLHELEGTHYTPDATFGLTDGSSHGVPRVMPLEDPAVLEQFRRTFNLRRTTEPGLSVVVPYSGTGIEHRDLLEVVYRGYYYSLLSGDLEVEIETPDQKTLLNAETFDRHLSEISDDTAAEVRTLADLSRAALNGSETINLAPQDSSGRPRWNDKSFPELKQDEAAELYESGAIVSVSVPVRVADVDGKNLKIGSFQVHVLRDQSVSRTRPDYIREALWVKNEGLRNVPNVSGARALVVVDEGPLADMLRDAENIAHTEWLKNSANFKDKYRYGSSVIDFVVGSATRFQRWLVDESGKEDPALLVDLFSLPVVEEEVSPITPTRKPKPGGGKVSGIKGGAKRGPSPFVVNKAGTGFSVRVNPDADDLPQSVRIQVAYDVLKGNPFNSWKSLDFELLSGGVVQEPPLRDGVLVSQEDNALVYRVTGEEFEVGFNGFDTNRDLVVAANAAKISE